MELEISARGRVGTSLACMTDIFKLSLENRTTYIRRKKSVALFKLLKNVNKAAIIATKATILFFHFPTLTVS